MRVVRRGLGVAALLGFGLATSGKIVARPNPDREIVSRAIGPVMKRYGLPGMAVGITMNGRHFLFNYGFSSKATGQRVDFDTLFEIGSITKTFTATLAAYAARRGRLALSDRVSADFPALRGTAFSRVRLVDLATHTSGGLPLQFPDAVRTDGDAITFYRHWKPVHRAGTYRLYANTGIMLLGLIAAHRLGESFTSAMQHDVFDPLGLGHTFLVLPSSATTRYAQGYTEEGTPRRMVSGPLAAEAYGIRTTSSDLLTFLDANMGLVRLAEPLRGAIALTHTGYFRLGRMTQDLIWEQYAYPAALRDLQKGNSVWQDDDAVTPFQPPQPPRRDVLLNKTGSTNGFSAYVAFIPQRRIGVVILANRSYPIEARVNAAYAILEALERGGSR